MINNKEIPTIEELIMVMNLNVIIAIWDVLDFRTDDVEAVINLVAIIQF
ncbi:MAG: hypothetical protein J6D28_04235 [Bacilli bacterium]|nr:hypothetical protein [Bacilli bacterium]